MTNDELPRKRLLEIIQGCSGTAQDQRNSLRFTLWLLVWAITYVAASFALKSDMSIATPLVWLLAAIPNLVMVAAIFSYIQFLSNADELLRKIQLQGLAMGFGAAIVFVTGYQLLEAAGASEMQTDHLIIVMVFSWVAGQMYGAWHYR